MKSAVESLSPSRVKFTIEVPADELRPSLDAAYKRIAGQVNVPGFRKGHVPARIIDQRFGRGAVLEEAVNEAVPKAYDQAVRESGVVPLGRPEVDITGIEDDLAFTAEVDIRPEFELPPYEGIEVVVDSAEISAERIDEQLDALRKRFAKLTPVERTAANGDVLLVDLSGEHEGSVVEDLTANALSYEVGTDGIVPGFDDAVVGAGIGDERQVTFTPEGGEWVGKSITVTAKINSVRERELPEADDSFAQLASEFDTIAELRDDLSGRLSRLRPLEQGYEARDKVMAALLASLEVAMPEQFLAAQVDEHFADGHGDESHREEVASQARDSLKSQFLLDRIADEQTLTVSESDLSAWLVQQAPRYGMSPDAFAQALAQSGDVPAAIADVRRGKAMAWVLEHAKVTDTDGNPVDLTDLDDLTRDGLGAVGDHEHGDHDHWDDEDHEPEA